MPKRSKAKSKDKLNIKKSEKGRRAAPPKRLKIPVSIPALEAAATKAAEFAAKHEAVAAESKGAAQQRRSDADAARQEVAKLEAAAKKARLDATKSVAAVKEENNRAAKLGALAKKARREATGREAVAERARLAAAALEAAATKAADFAAKHEAAAAESKGTAEERRSDADAARQEVRSSRLLQRRQNSMPPIVRLR
jgi:hypothetical protein